MDNRLIILKGNITDQDVDAIVNAANNSLLGGGGVDGAIHRAAGPRLLQECKQIGGCPTGDARMTAGYGLPAKWVIHTVGPVWRGGSANEEELLGNCYKSVFNIVQSQGIKTIAFPSVSTGVYRFPLEKAVPIAVREMCTALAGNKILTEVRVVCFEQRVYDRYIYECDHKN